MLVAFSPARFSHLCDRLSMGAVSAGSLWCKCCSVIVDFRVSGPQSDLSCVNYRVVGSPKRIDQDGFSVKPAICRATRRSRDTGGPQIMPPRGGATATACSPLGPQLLRRLAELAIDLRLGEKTGEGGVRDGVVAGERP
jgi:hypothetical protein